MYIYIIKLESYYFKSGAGKVNCLYAKVDCLIISNFIDLYLNSN
jgi:hypothetical protein